MFGSDILSIRFSAEHAFEKPNDENALNLMNSCAVSMLEQFPDIVFAYGVSDEYRYVLYGRKLLSFTKDGRGHINNQYNTCFWMLVKSGKTQREAQELLKVEEVVKLVDTGNPVTRTRSKVVVEHKDIIGPKFWSELPYILKEE
ncbi:hypothetical protein GW17_00015416 [Ensete ventricosum]|nr:hypothetical protein GW17_00015416 [Ensete ventricosum]RZS05383.1 hypothetical protein BHM03_00035892 [Ensete ventricosum]